MMNCMDELIAFLGVRYDEDEAAAKAAHHEGQRWLTEEEGVYRWPDDELVHSADRKADARHIAMHAPAAVLRDVAAKRAIVERCERAINDQGIAMEDGQEALAECVLVQLGTEFSEHPEYKQEWAPWW